MKKKTDRPVDSVAEFGQGDQNNKFNGKNRVD
jgi:hypothetical protein